MKKSVIKKLKDLAAEMPPKLEKAITYCTGAELIKKGHKTQPDGLTIKPKAKYQVTGSRLVNHYEKIKECFKVGGIEKVVIYCNEIMPKPIISEQIQQNLKNQSNAETTN